jgi:luciferase family oxidoreductase group 1
MFALRRDPQSADTFPQDVLELQGYLTGHTRVSGVDAVPGKGANVPLYILGSSLFGAKLAGALGLPYAFASHFAPAALHEAIAAYRADFRPSEQLGAPYVIAGCNVIAADTAAAAAEQLQAIRRTRAIGLFARTRGISAGELELGDADADQLLAAGLAPHVDEMLTYAAVGTPAEVGDYLDSFRSQTGADELIVTHQAPAIEDRLRSVTLLAEAMTAVVA